MVYMNLEKKEFSAEKLASANKYAIEEIGDDCKDNLRFDDDGDKASIEEVGDDGTLFVMSESKYGTISFDVKLSDDDLIDLIGLVTKRLNKFKSVIESLK